MEQGKNKQNRRNTSPKPDANGNLRVCLLSYRSNPHCGGQGVYIKNLSRALMGLGHKVDVISGPPYPELDPGVGLIRLQGLDLYNPEDPFRFPRLKELTDPVNMVEWLSVSSMGFPEPMTFGMRAQSYLKKNRGKYDVVHDNQSLSYGVRRIGKWIPTVATIHHPITVDRDVALQSVRSFFKKAQILRWYSFIGMQKRVSRDIRRILTVSECSKDDLARKFGISPDSIRVVGNGINTDLFRPVPGVEREPNTLMVTNSADTPLKGLYHLLKAVNQVRKTHPVQLMVIGKPKKNGGIQKLVRELDLGDVITFTGRVSDEDFVRHYARTSMAVVPSLYEGFGFPAGEAMACGVPVISTTGGALPEVVGEAGVLVPPADPMALKTAIIDLLDNPEKARKLGTSGFERVHRLFTWKAAAEKTVDAYREAIHAHH